MDFVESQCRNTYRWAYAYATRIPGLLAFTTCSHASLFFLAPGSKYDILINGIRWFQKAVSIPYSNGLSVLTSPYMKVKHLSHWIPMEWMFSNGLMFWMFLWGFNPTSGWIISYIPSNISNNLHQQIPSHMRTMVLVYLPTWLGDFYGKCWKKNPAPWSIWAWHCH